MEKDDLVRCSWADLTKPDYVKYHDEEWGVPTYDDNTIFEFIILESAQAGLNWYTILKKRDEYRKTFANFNPRKVSQFTQDGIEGILLNSNIVKNRRKVEAAVNNAKKFLEVQKEFGTFSDYIWSFVNHKPINNIVDDNNPLPPKTELSEKLSKDLKKRGFTFVGPVICYSLMQAIGMVNDHHKDCYIANSNL